MLKIPLKAKYRKPKYDWTHHHNINVSTRKKIYHTWKEADITIAKEFGPKKVKVENANGLFKKMSIDNINELNDLIYAAAKLVSDKIGIPQIERQSLDGKWG